MISLCVSAFGHLAELGCTPCTLAARLPSATALFSTDNLLVLLPLCLNVRLLVQYGRESLRGDSGGPYDVVDKVCNVCIFSSSVSSMVFTWITFTSTMCVCCKEYTSYYRKLATKTVYIQQEELHEH